MPNDKPVYYKNIGHEEEIFLHAFRHQLPLMLKGPTGCGKSRFVEAMAQKLGRPLVQVSCNDETSSVDLIGRFLIKGQETVWQDGPILRCLKDGAILYLDEYIEAREDVMVIIHPLTDYRREIYVERLNQAFKAPADFMVVVSFNPGYQRGLKELKPSTRQRFLGIDFNYPTASVESEIVQHESQVLKKMADKLIEYGRKVRTLQELGLSSSVSTRLLVNAGILIHAGVNPRIACETAIVQPLTDDPESIVALNDLAHLLF